MKYALILALLLTGCTSAPKIEAPTSLTVQESLSPVKGLEQSKSTIAVVVENVAHVYEESRHPTVTTTRVTQEIKPSGEKVTTTIITQEPAQLTPFDWVTQILEWLTAIMTIVIAWLKFKKKEA